MILMVLALILVIGGMVVMLVRNPSASTATAVAGRIDRFGLTPGTETPAATAPNENAMARSVERMVGTGRLAQSTAVRLERADLKMTVGEFLTFSLIAFLTLALVGLLLRGSLGLVLGAAIGLAAPHLYLSRRIKRRRKALITQLADMAQMLSNSLKAGFSIVQSMELVARDAPAPASREFDRVVSEVRLGLPIDVALEHLLHRMPSEDLELMVVAINVQRQIGGNLAEILDVIARTVRERVRFQRDLRALTAQARYSSYIITGLPIGVGIVINLLDHQYESYLYTSPVGHLMLGTAVIMIAVGFFVLNKIATIEI